MYTFTILSKDRTQSHVQKEDDEMGNALRNSLNHVLAPAAAAPRKLVPSKIMTLPLPETLLPGFGRPLNYHPGSGDPDFVGRLFPTALSPQKIRGNTLHPYEYLDDDVKYTMPMTTLRELTMLQLMNSITDKPDWQSKINDPEIARKWKDEALASDRDITHKMIDWCINEIRYKATLIPDPPAHAPPMFVYNGDVIKSDTAISEELKKELQEAVEKFENKIPEKLKDWHPRSDKKVWDLVHPSLFPLVYGRTRILDNGETTTFEDCIQRCSQGQTSPVPQEKHTRAGTIRDFFDFQSGQKPYSKKFQWLPCEVDLAGREAKITTYINNLHPQEEPHLYKLIENLISVSIPLWDLTLAPLRDEQYFDQLKLNRRIPYDCAHYDPDPEYGPETEGPQQEPGENRRTFWNRRSKWYDDTRRVVLPEPRDSFIPLKPPSKFSLKEEYGNRGLQVIVKLANIELTPENPEYNGGTWHVEGQNNEHIVATSVYYYSCQNITTSNLLFRQQCAGGHGREIDYRQDHHEWLPLIFGLDQEGPAVQEIGGVETREGRLLTFPNILQHRVGPFKLADPTKPGHRKIVALFLVDPNIKIISTAHVPCQQQDWWWWNVVSAVQDELVSSSSSASTKMAGLNQLPQELQDKILEDVDFPFSLQEAKELRLELMEERKQFVIDENEDFESTVFSLCEH